MVTERGQKGRDSETEKIPLLFESQESIHGLTWPKITFSHGMTIYLGNAGMNCRAQGTRRRKAMHLSTVQSKTTEPQSPWSVMLSCLPPPCGQQGQEIDKTGNQVFA